ncbi:MAG: hypothetical protein GX767_01520 [Firmicutes bacterium]|nr:hypothetical protein [Bacillota bacterium]
MLVLVLLLLAPFAFMILLGLFILPFHFFTTSLFNVLTVPFQLFKIAFNPALRANHALEHATINVIEEQLGPLPLTGQGEKNGFLIQGPLLSPEIVYEAAQVALERLKMGEKDLVVHRRCGTSILSANFLFSLLFLFFLWRVGYFSFFNILLSLIAAQLLGPYLGVWAQKYITTSTRVHNMEIVGVESFFPHAKTNFWPGRMQHTTSYFVCTRRYILADKK